MIKITLGVERKRQESLRFLFISQYGSGAVGIGKFFLETFGQADGFDAELTVYIVGFAETERRFGAPDPELFGYFIAAEYPGGNGTAKCGEKFFHKKYILSVY